MVYLKNVSKLKCLFTGKLYSTLNLQRLYLGRGCEILINVPE